MNGFHRTIRRVLGIPRAGGPVKVPDELLDDAAVIEAARGEQQREPVDLNSAVLPG
jgi:hypothetical protein